MGFKLNIWKVITICFLLLAIVIIFPFIKHLPFLNIQLLLDNHNEFSTTLWRTIFYALISGIILMIFGFCGAIILKDIPFFSWLGKNLGLLILPITLGNISIAFICKLLIGDSSFFFSIVAQSVVYKLIFLILLQIWQFGLLFVYLFWLHFQNIPTNYYEYAVANRFSLFQIIKDIYFQHSKNLWLLLGSIGFVFSLYEESKIYYLFKVSQGTNSELITNWLTRNYQSSLLVNTDYAQNIAFNAGKLIFMIAVFALIFLFLSINTVFKISSRIKLYPYLSGQLTKSRISGIVWSIILLISVITPLILSLAKIQFSFNTSILKLGFPLFMTFAATIFATFIAVIFGISIRIGWQNRLSSFSNRSLIFFILLFVLMLTPPLIILISSYNWMGIWGYHFDWIIYAIWIASHTILILPILGSFILFNHFRVSTNELNYLKVFKLRNIELIRNSFLTRFKAEYLLLFIIGFSFIWNEAIINNLFSDYIPSFVSGLKMLITGRGADFSHAFGYLLVSILIAISAVIVWRHIIERAHRLTKKT